MIRRGIAEIAIAARRESLREVAVLIAVFAPLDFILQQRALTTMFILAMIGGVLPLFVVGIFLEVRGRWIR